MRKDLGFVGLGSGYGLAGKRLDPDGTVANGFVYAFGDAATNGPLLTISFAAGRTVLTTPQLLRRCVGVAVKIRSTTDLADWSAPDEQPVSATGVTTIDGAAAPARFFKLAACEEE